MRRQRLSLVIAAALSSGLWAYACGDGTTEPTPRPEPPDPPRATTVMVTPAGPRLTALGATVQLSAQVLDQNGQAMAGAAVSWSSSAASVASVSGSGLVTAVANGTATITATVGAASGSVTVTVAQTLSVVTVSPAVDTVVVGDTLRLSAEAADANGHAVAGAEFAWASSDTLAAVVDDSGLVTAVAAGEAAVTATSSGVMGHAALTVVAPAPTTVAVTPGMVAFTAIGQTAQLEAEVLDQAGRAMAGVALSWSSADTTIAMVSGAGRVTAAGAGTTTITAMAGAASGTAVVTVEQVAGSVVVSPPADTIAPGDTLRLSAEAYDENGHRVDGAAFTWSSSDASIARVNDSGLVRGAREGRATITAMAGDVRGTSEVTVESPDRAVLAALYEATGGPNWVNNDGWLTDAPLGDWYGVDTNVSGRVWRLDLGGNELSGLIPAELGSLASLTHLYLKGNRLTGPIPAELGSLPRLVDLWLQENQLNGRIPPQLGSLAFLTQLFLNGNRLSGQVPPELGSLANLNNLGLSENQLTGPIPPELGSLANLNNLDLSENRLSGPVPSQLGSLAELRRLFLGGNELSGPIPPELASLANLTHLWLNGNRLSGPIPPELGGLTSLTELNFAPNELTGPIPQDFLQLDRLDWFTVSGNEQLCVPGSSGFVRWLQGIETHDAKPETFCNAADVDVLKSLFEATGGAGWTASDGWQGDGVVEEWHGVSADSLGRVTGLDLTRNGLAGQLPGTLGALAAMTVLRIGNNALSGRLPLSMAQLSLREFHYADTELCVPADASFQAWLNAMSSHEGTDVECAPAILTNLSVDPPSLAPAQAGKQGRDTIYVTVTDAAGAPVEDASYRWTTDRNSGWVFPSEGMTSDDGHIEATWVAGWPGDGLLSLSVENSVSALTTEIPTQSTESANPPSGALYVNMNHEGTSTGYSIDITPLTEPPKTYYAAIQWDGGYTGLQRAGSRYDRQLQFSVWDAPGFGDAELVERGEGVVCRTFGNEGTGQACELEYPWRVGSTYRFEVTEQEMNGGSAMALHVTDLSTSQRRFVGTLRFARRARMDSLHMFVEDFRPRAKHCLAGEVRSAAIRRAMILIHGEWQPVTVGYLGKSSTDSNNPGTPGCANVAGRTHASGLEVVIGAEEVGDPNGSIRVTIPN